MSKQKKHIIFFVVCMIILGIVSFSYIRYQEYQKEYNQLYLLFLEPEDSYEVGSQIEALSFIKDTNAIDVDLPNINSTKVGESSFVYTVIGQKGVKKEFVLLLNFVDPIKPIITLTQSEVKIIEGDDIDLALYIKESYDPVDGVLDVVIDAPKDYLRKGTHKIIYTVEDKSGNVETAELSLVVLEKEKKNNIPKDDSTRQETAEKRQETKDKPKKNNSTKKSNEPSVKAQKFLFGKTYEYNGKQVECNMSNANEICHSQLSKSGKSGSCVPLKSDGVYIGIELRFY